MIKATRLRHITIGSEDISRSVAYFEDTLGLGIVDRSIGDGKAVAFATSSDQVSVVVEQGADPKLKRISFEISPSIELKELERKPTNWG